MSTEVLEHIRQLPPARDDPVIFDYERSMVGVVFALVTEDTGDGVTWIQFEEGVTIRDHDGQEGRVDGTMSIHKHVQNGWLASPFPLEQVTEGDSRRPAQPIDMQKVAILIGAIDSMKWRCIDMCRRWWNINDQDKHKCSIRYIRRLLFYSAVRAEALGSLIDYATQWMITAARMKSGMTNALDQLRDKITGLELFGDSYGEEVTDCVEAMSDHPEWQDMWVDPQ